MDTSKDSQDRFKVITLDDPLQMPLLLPFVEEGVKRGSLQLSISPEDYVRNLLIARLSNGQVAIYGVYDNILQRIAAICILAGGGFNPTIWIEYFAQDKSYTKYNISELLFAEVMKELWKLGINKVWMMTRKKGLAKRLVTKGKAKPEGLVLSVEVRRWVEEENPKVNKR